MTHDVLDRLFWIHFAIGLIEMDIYGLTAFNSKPQRIEKIKKGFCKIFRENDLKITVEANVTKVNFLDVTLDLQSGKHYHYIKKGKRSTLYSQEI